MSRRRRLRRDVSRRKAGPPHDPRHRGQNPALRRHRAAAARRSADARGPSPSANDVRQFARVPRLDRRRCRHAGCPGLRAARGRPRQGTWPRRMLSICRGPEGRERGGWVGDTGSDTWVTCAGVWGGVGTECPFRQERRATLGRVGRCVWWGVVSGREAEMVSRGRRGRASLDMRAPMREPARQALRASCSWGARAVAAGCRCLLQEADDEACRPRRGEPCQLSRHRGAVGEAEAAQPRQPRKRRGIQPRRHPAGSDLPGREERRLLQEHPPDRAAGCKNLAGELGGVPVFGL